MLKKYLFTSIVVLGLSAVSLCDAKAQSNIDNSYNFTSGKRILTSFLCPTVQQDQFSNNYHLIYDREIEFGLFRKLRNQGYKIETVPEALHNLSKTLPNDKLQLLASNSNKASLFIMDYIKNNYDMGIQVEVNASGTNMQYREGFTFYLPTTQTSSVSGTISNNYGGLATYNGSISTNTYQPVTVEPGYIAKPYCSIGLKVTDIKTDRIVWSRLDARQRTNSNIFQDKSPVSMFERIMKDLSKDVEAKLTGVAIKIPSSDSTKSSPNNSVNTQKNSSNAAYKPIADKNSQEFIPKTKTELSKLSNLASKNISSGSVKVVPNSEKWIQYASSEKGWVWWYDPSSINNESSTSDNVVKVKVCFYKPQWGYVIANYVINYTNNYYAQMDAISFKEATGREFSNSKTEPQKGYYGKKHPVDPAKANPYSMYGYFKKFSKASN